MIEITKSDEAFDYAPEPLFTIEGKVYECPTRFPAGVGIAYLDLYNRLGEEHANTWLMRRALGPEAFAALVTDENVPEDAMVTIMAMIIGRLRNRAPKSRSTTNGSSNGSAPKATANGSRKSSGSRSSAKKSRVT